jgi:hypothetical protein
MFCCRATRGIAPAPRPPGGAWPEDGPQAGPLRSGWPKMKKKSRVVHENSGISASFMRILLAGRNNILNSLFFIEKFFLPNRLTRHPKPGIFHPRRC